MRTNRPPFIVSSADVPEKTHRYPNSDEDMAPARPIGRAAGLLRIGIHLVRVPPGRRTSYPHAESAFPSGTGRCHSFINDGERDALLLSGGEADKSNNRIYYPLNPGRRSDMPWSRWWDDVPKRPQGAHDGKPRPR